MEKSTLKQTLTEGTEIVKKTINAEINFNTFLKTYANFYYFNALDGHEKDSISLEDANRYSTALNFHKEVQTSIVDIVYTGEDQYSDKYLKAGRITIEEAQERLKKLAERFNIDNMLSSLALGDS